MAGIKLAILDKDGTLLDSSPATLQAHIQTLSVVASDEETTRLINNTLGYSADRQYAIIRTAKERKLPVEDIIGHETEYAEDIARLRNDAETLQLLDNFWEIVKKIPALPFSDTEEALRLLKNARFSLGIFTGYRSDIAEAQLEKSRLIKYFDKDLIFGHNPPIVKGDPHIQELIRRRELTNAQLRQVYMIGDGVGEMETAKKYGMIAYGIDRTGTEEQLRSAGAIKVFPNLIECAHYIIKRSK